MLLLGSFMNGKYQTEVKGRSAHPPVGKHMFSDTPFPPSLDSVALRRKMHDNPCRFD